MPRKKQKIKYKSNTKKNKTPNICITLSLCPNTRSKICVETTNKGSVLIKCKCKGIASKSSKSAQEILAYLYQNYKWDVISDVVSWCCSFNTEKILDDEYWRQYIIQEKLTISKSKIKAITKTLQNVIDATLSETYYSRKDWNSFGYALSIKQLQSVFASYFKRYSNDKYIIPNEIITLCYSFYGNICRFHLDSNNILSFEFKKQALTVDTIKNDTFIDLIGRYILFKQNFILSSFASSEFNFVFKPIDLMNQNLNIGIAIYNEQISNEIMNEEMVFVEKKYRNQRHNFIWLRQKKWNKDEMYILRVTFDPDTINEEKVCFSLSVALHDRNGAVLERTFYPIRKFKPCDMRRRCHIVMDTLHTHTFRIKLLEYIDPSILNCFQWRDNLQIGDTVYIVNTVFIAAKPFIVIDIDDDDNVHYMKYKYENIHKMHRNNHRISRNKRMKYGGELDLFSDRVGIRLYYSSHKVAHQSYFW